MEIPRHWRLKKQRYGLVGKICRQCDHKIFPPRDICPHCGGDVTEEKATQARIDTYTTVFKPGSEEAPIAVVFQPAAKQPIAA